MRSLITISLALSVLLSGGIYSIASGSQIEPLLKPQPEGEQEQTPTPTKPAKKPRPVVKEQFGVNKTKFNAMASGGWDQLYIHANTAWEITQAPDDWVKFSRDNDLINIVFAENELPEPRSTSMILHGAGKDIHISFNQNGHVEFKIKEIQMANSDALGQQIFSGYGEPFYFPETHCFLAKLVYDGPEEAEKKHVLVRITRPGGFIDTYYNSPDGYTFDCNIDVEPGIDNETTLLPWGSDDNLSLHHFPGTYLYEIWIDNVFAGTKRFEVLRKPGRPGVVVEDAWLESDAFNDAGERGFNIHVRLRVLDFDGGSLGTNVMTFKSDNETKLYDKTGSRISVPCSEIITGNDVLISDKVVFVPASIFGKGIIDEDDNDISAETDFALQLQITNANAGKFMADVMYFPIHLTPAEPASAAVSAEDEAATTVPDGN